MIQSTLNSPTTHTYIHLYHAPKAKRSMPKFYFLDSISQNSENESPITLLLLMEEYTQNGVLKLVQPSQNGVIDKPTPEYGRLRVG